MDIRPGDALEGPSGKRIKILEVCGSGAYATVFRGELPDGTMVAVKSLNTSLLKDDELARFQDEARAAALIEHENVVRILHFADGSGATVSSPYLVMEYAAGGSLAEVLTRRSEDETFFTPVELRDMFVQLATGMRAVNDRVIHRDLKPGNVLISAVEGPLKVSDFGLAKFVGASTRTHTVQGAGTYQYMAPEAFDYEPTTLRVDVYAAGVMFYEVATLRLPFEPDPVGDVRDDGARRIASRLRRRSIRFGRTSPTR